MVIFLRWNKNILIIVVSFWRDLKKSWFFILSQNQSENVNVID